MNFTLFIFSIKMKNSVKYMVNILSLPEEIILNILSYLTITEILNIRVTCYKLLALSDFRFSKTINYIKTIKDYNKLKLIKEIYFKKNNIISETQSININFYEIRYEYFSKFNNYSIDYYYKKLMDSKIIDIYNKDIFITIFSKYILKDFKKYYENSTGKKIYNKIIYKHFINNILRIFINSDIWTNLRYLYIVLPQDYMKYKKLEENYNIVKFIEETNLFEKNIIDIENFCLII